MTVSIVTDDGHRWNVAPQIRARATPRGKRHSMAALTAARPRQLVTDIRVWPVDLVDAQAGGFGGSDGCVEASTRLGLTPRSW